MPTPRVVLDTNTVMALWLFDDPRLHALKQALARKQLQPVCRSDALDELRCVLAYPQFALDAGRQSTLLEAYAETCDWTGTSPPEPLPRCRDADDQKFLEIALCGRARWLVSRDKALLKLARHRLVRAQFSILTPEALCLQLAQDSPPATTHRDD